MEGKHIDRSALIRLAAEFIWLPTAFLPSKQARWEVVDSNSALFHFRESEHEVTLRFFFRENGQIERISAKRAADDGKGQHELRDWEVRPSNWQETGGIHIPFNAEVGWYYDGVYQPDILIELTDIEYDIDELY